ncbi:MULTISPECIES: hypothetical protein [unclassified Yoonia]|uniref:hypothetical protein n=1 Tax=unclassified Yoonia TaxID=2629118 RepID=UPI002AFF1345|nr:MULTISPECIES: hypothetical protein [unclassified Yoonia]
MSYDLLVFDPAVAPRGRTEFMIWYNQLVKWNEDRDYNSPVGVTGNLREFYEVMRKEFPPMNGPDAYDFDQPSPPLLESKPKGFLSKIFGSKALSSSPPPAFNEALVTDYCIAGNAIYIAFAWSVSDLAYNRVFNTALTTGVGFFNVSADSGEILHDLTQFEHFMGL